MEWTEKITLTNMGMIYDDMAASLLQYLCTSNDRISDGLNFIRTSIDVDSCRRISEKIFRHMGQGQHFDMMIKRQQPIPV